MTHRDLVPEAVAVADFPAVDPQSGGMGFLPECACWDDTQLEYYGIAGDLHGLWFVAAAVRPGGVKTPQRLCLWPLHDFGACGQ